MVFSGNIVALPIQCHSSLRTSDSYAGREPGPQTTLGSVAMRDWGETIV